MHRTRRIIVATVMGTMAACLPATQADAGIWDHLNLFKRHRRPSRPVYVPFDHPTYGFNATRWRKFPGSHGQYHELGFGDAGLPHGAGVMYGPHSFGMPAQPMMAPPMLPPASSTYEEPKLDPAPAPPSAPAPTAAPEPPGDTLPLPTPASNTDSAMARPPRNVFGPTARPVTYRKTVPAQPTVTYRKAVPAPRSVTFEKPYPRRRKLGPLLGCHRFDHGRPRALDNKNRGNALNQGGRWNRPPFFMRQLRFKHHRKLRRSFRTYRL